MRRAAGPSLVLAALALAASPPAGAEEKKPEKKAESPLLEQGRKALAAGKTGEARAIFLEARALRPEDADVLAELFRTDAKDPEARFLWLMEAASAGSDPAGRAFLPKGFPPVPPEENAAVRALLARRAAALQELRKAAKEIQGPPMASLQAWMRRVGARLAAGSPALRKEFLVPLAEAEAKSAPDRDCVHAALRALIERGKSSGKPVLGLEAARILRGLRYQALQKKSPAGVKGGPAGGAELELLDGEVQAFREEVAAAWGKPMTAAEVLALPPSAGPEFQRLHGSWADPGIALTPKSLYRIETTGGLETLQAVVRNAERCHARLVRWFGKDPFGGAQGRIRLRPADADMESDGAPYWWSGGWQTGRLTVLRTCFEDVPGLCATLTHELTHRFDGAVHPGMPAWLMEGRAVHAETCSGAPSAESLDESRWSPGRLHDAYNAGAGDPAVLAKLLEGTGDYRDNYTTGYALWIFLTTWRGFGEPTPDPIFASRVPGYIDGAATAGVARFKAAFTDGQEGRPADLAAFAAKFAEFLYGVAGALPEKEPKWVEPWRARMWGKAPADAGGKGGDEEMGIYDRSNWPKSRVRSAPAEPGTDQARRAAALLLEQKLPKERVAALEWAVAVDDATASLLEEAAGAHAAVGEAVPAWALRRTADTLFRGPGAAAADAPPKELAALLKAAGLVAEALDAETDRAASRGLPRLALALRAERDDLAVLLGLAGKGLPGGAAPPFAAEGADPAPLCDAWTSLATADLAGRIWAPLGGTVSDNWHRSGDTSLALGSTKDATGDITTQWFQGVFVESPVRLEGTYSVETAWRSASPYFEALLVVGKEGEDRGFSVSIGGGDQEAAIRRKKTGTGIASLHVELSDGRPLEEKLSPVSKDVPVGGDGAAIRVAVHVSGPSILVCVNGEPVIRHRRLTGAAIAGTVGFGLRHGTVDVVNPRFRRHRAAGDGRECACGAWDAPIPWNAAGELPARMLLGRRLSPAAPSPSGGLLYWYTEANLPSHMLPKALRKLAASVEEAIQPRSGGFATLVSLPPAGKLLDGLDWTPPEEKESGLAPGGLGVHASQPAYAARIWSAAAGGRAPEFLKPGLTPEQREVHEKEVEKDMESPLCFWLDPDGIVRRVYNGATSFYVPGIDDRLVRYFVGW